MRQYYFIIAALVVSTYANNQHSTSKTDTCYTITQTTGGPCPVPTTSCEDKTCYAYATITQSCGCPTIPTSYSCVGGCGNGCHTAYTTLVMDCFTISSTAETTPTPTPTPTPTDSSTTILSSSSSESTVSYSTTTLPVSTKTPPPESSTTLETSTSSYYSNITTVYTTIISTLTECPSSTICSGQTLTLTSVELCSSKPTCTVVLPGGTQTLTVCPASMTCSGQTTQWTSTAGPSSCVEGVTCNVVYPDVSTSAGKTGPSVTKPAATVIQAGGAERNSGAAGVVVGVLLGFLGIF